MNNGILDLLSRFGRGPGYWSLLLLTGLASEGVALYYQHVLGEYPCVLCIHVRIWMLALILLSLVAALWLRRHAVSNLLAHVLTIVIAAGLLERSYQLLGTERGFTFGDCGFDLGLPAWLPLDRWFPAIFQVQTSCGYTPELLFGITMAEALIVFSALFLLWGLLMSVAAVAGLRRPA